MNTENKIPRWNLSSIFSSLEDPRYKKEIESFREILEKTDRKIEEAKKVKSSFEFVLWLENFLIDYNLLLALSQTLSAYAYIVYSTDTTNSSYMNNMTFVQELTSKTDLVSLSFNEILFLHKDSLEEFYGKSEKNEEYRYILNECVEDKKHRMTKAKEKLANDLNRTGGSAWSMLQEQIISNLTNSEGKTFNEIRNEAYSPDCEIRKKAWEEEISLLKQNQIALAASLNNIKGETITLNKGRSWQNALDRSLFSSRLSYSSLHSLMTAIEDSFPMWRKYFQAKAKILRKTESTASLTAGKENEKGLAFYDLFAPLPKTDSEENKNESLLSKKWTFDEAKEFILKEYKSFSSDMADFAKKAFELGWIDAEVRKGKVGGAYDEDFALGHQSRVLSNFTGTFSDVITLAHEIGHAYHFSCLKEKDPVFFSYPMTLAETASTFAETIVKQDAIKTSQGFDKISMIETDLQDVSQVLVDIACRFYFEKSVFEERSRRELSSEDFCRLMKDAQEKTYGCGLNSERHEYMWAVKSHYYSSDFDFYNYPYAFGQLFAAGLYQKAMTEEKDFSKKYAILLSHTGSMSCESLCKEAGFDISKKEFWESGIKMYQNEIEEFVKYADRL